MSKAEVLQTLKTLAPEELDEIANELDQLRGVQSDELANEELKILQDRISQYRADPNPGDEWTSVMDRIVNNLK